MPSLGSIAAFAIKDSKNQHEYILNHIHELENMKINNGKMACYYIIGILLCTSPFIVLYILIKNNISIPESGHSQLLCGCLGILWGMITWSIPFFRKGMVYILAKGLRDPKRSVRVRWNLGIYYKDECHDYMEYIKNPVNRPIAEAKAIDRIQGTVKVDEKTLFDDAYIKARVFRIVGTLLMIVGAVGFIMFMMTV